MRDNIKIGSINSINAEELDLQIKEAIDYIGLTKVVDKLPKGINTSLGKLKEDGQDVSGGEWQRIAMARAVINPAPLRILDEPTAALDPISESKLYEKFEQISKGKTTIFISHRLGSTKLADEIFVVGEGRVLEKGNHEELMNINGLYSEMYESQRSWYQ
jgi:ATP-binding cassette subfamily B protein